jgi:hypothetical protein
MPLVFGLVSIFYLSKGKRPSLIKILVAVIFFLLISSYLRENREAQDGYQPAATKQVSSSGASSVLLTFSGNDDEMFDTLCNVISVYPSVNGFKPLGLITDIGIRAIPRVLMRDKPLETPDEYMITLWPNVFRRSRGGYADSILGAFYIYGGIIAVGIYSFLLGVLLRSIWCWYRRQPRNLNSLLIYAFVPSLTIILMRGTIPDTIARTFYTLLPMLIGIRYWSSINTVSGRKRQAV